MQFDNCGECWIVWVVIETCCRRGCYLLHIYWAIRVASEFHDEVERRLNERIGRQSIGESYIVNSNVQGASTGLSIECSRPKLQGVPTNYDVGKSWDQASIQIKQGGGPGPTNF